MKIRLLAKQHAEHWMRYRIRSKRRQWLPVFVSHGPKPKHLLHQRLLGEFSQP